MGRLDIARYLIETMPPVIKAQGAKKALLAPAPAPWLLNLDQGSLSLAEDAILNPDDPSVYTLLDIWSDRGKVFLCCWVPEKPWIPPSIISLKRGPWLQSIGYAAD